MSFKLRDYYNCEGSSFPGSTPVGKKKELLYESANGVDTKARTVKNCKPNKFYPALNARFEDVEKARAARALISSGMKINNKKQKPE